MKRIEISFQVLLHSVVGEMQNSQGMGRRRNKRREQEGRVRGKE